MVEESQESAVSEVSQSWDASQYETALAHLEQLQEQLDSLRSTIPSLVAPLLQPATSKGQMFVAVKQSALDSTNSIKAFRETWNSEQTQQLFAKSQSSLEKNGDLSKAENVPRFGWAEE